MLTCNSILCVLYVLSLSRYERAATLGFRCVRDVEPDKEQPQQLVQLRWSGPPPAFNMLTATTTTSSSAAASKLWKGHASRSGSSSASSTANAVVEWARWNIVANNTIHTVRPSSAAAMHGNARSSAAAAAAAAAAIGALKCTGNGVAIAAQSSIARFSWDGAAAPDLPRANATNDAVQCVGPTTDGFQLSVTASGNGPQTLALYGGVVAGGTLIVRAAVVGRSALVRVVASPAELKDSESGVSDAILHVTFDEAAGTVLNVTFALNASSRGNGGGKSWSGLSASALAASNSSSNNTYTEFESRNCFHGHGAVDIDTTPVTNLTVSQCTARCDADTACSCVQYLPAGNARWPSGTCWKRAQCTVSAHGASIQYIYVCVCASIRILYIYIYMCIYMCVLYMYIYILHYFLSFFFFFSGNAQPNPLSRAAL